MEVVWVDEVFTGTLALSTEYHSAKKPMLLPRRHLEAFQSANYIRGLFFLHP